MKIAFYAPLKSPDHPVPSGDRLMARQFVRILGEAGHSVEIASQLRSFHATPETVLPDLEAAAKADIDRLTLAWEADGPPDLWFCYHPYYKAPDLIGPVLARRFSLPYVTAEASYSARRNIGCWGRHQEALKSLVERAALNICLTARDEAGLAAAAPQARLARIAPFIDAEPFANIKAAPEAGRLVTVAMMRAGDKMQSYAALAEALQRVRSDAWRLVVIGDGPERDEVKRLFALLPPERIELIGELPREGVMEQLARAGVFVWPGHGEAYGLAYLEAQAAGLPVIAFETAGVPEVVADGRTGILTPPGDTDALAGAIDRLLQDSDLRRSLGQMARDFVLTEHSEPIASAQIAPLLLAALEYPL
ncbi:glycosyltransferase family 4 protein [Rhizobium glycinendophyticum]|uniref:Glycosyltransferase n=1 Tax=Rhizobium glycinendophyticum TaxID=2589807 RepID=A0A504UW80_9HYPH|nr:glycosyltransferase [Rhizobium glycinendophyticum]TPP09323.1 glycosyltransferase [Rhizobium glycinendophyticum]